MTNLVELARGRIGKLPGVVSVGLADIGGMEYLSVTLTNRAKKGDVVRAIKSLEKEGDGAIPYAIWRKGEPVPEETRPGIPEPKKKGGSMRLAMRSMAIRRMLGKEGKEAVEAQVIEFLSGNPAPSDPEVHDFAEGIGEDTEAVEAAFYALAGKFVEVLMAGRANEKGFSVEDADPDELAMGVKVEMEHTGNKDLAQRIALDHLAEAPTYYTALKQMEEGLGISGATEQEMVIKVDDDFWTGGGVTKEYPDSRPYYEWADAIKELNKAKNKYPDKKVVLIRDYGLASQEIVALREIEVGEKGGGMMPADEFFRKAKADDAFAPNRFDNVGTAKKFVEKLESLGAKVYVDEVYEDEGGVWSATLMVRLPKSLTPELLIAMSDGKADEMSQEGQYMRMWWD